MCSLSKEQSIRSRETIQNTFFPLELCPLLDFLSSIKHPTAEYWRCSCCTYVTAFHLKLSQDEKKKKTHSMIVCMYLDISDPS